MELAGAPTFDVRAPWPLLPAGRAESPSHLVKRLFDVAVALPLLILAAPIMLVAVLLVRVTSPGPALYLSARKGRGEEGFKMLKLRTMVAEADTMQTAVAGSSNGPVFFKVRSDPRVTRVGRLLRKFSIDELPQLVNVLKGEMSLVGPRPLLPEEIPNLPPGFRWARARVRPGMTGLWQVSGRSDLADEERLDLDRRYVAGWSLALDLKILFWTVPAVLRGRGAE